MAGECYEILKVTATKTGYDVKWKCPSGRNPKNHGDFVAIFNAKPLTREDAHYAAPKSWTLIDTNKNTGETFVPCLVKGAWAGYCQNYGTGAVRKPLKWTPVGMLKI